MWIALLVLIMGRFINTYEIAVEYWEYENALNTWEEVMVMIMRKFSRFRANGRSGGSDNRSGGSDNRSSGKDNRSSATNGGSNRGGKDKDSDSCSTDTYFDVYLYEKQKRKEKRKNRKLHRKQSTHIELTTLVDANDAINALSMRDSDDAIHVNTSNAPPSSTSPCGNDGITTINTRNAQHNDVVGDVTVKEYVKACAKQVEDVEEEYFAFNDFTLLYD